MNQRPNKKNRRHWKRRKQKLQQRPAGQAPLGSDANGQLEVVWRCPQEDFGRWNADTQGNQFTSYDHYRSFHSDGVDELYAAGHHPETIEYPYELLLLWLRRNGLENNPENRAAAHLHLYFGVDVYQLRVGMAVAFVSVFFGETPPPEATLFQHLPADLFLDCMREAEASLTKAGKHSHLVPFGWWRE